METEFFLMKRGSRSIKGRYPSKNSGGTFKLKSGIYYDVAVFAKATLNRINPPTG